jgi:hypothetical protein
MLVDVLLFEREEAAQQNQAQWEIEHDDQPKQGGDDDDQGLVPQRVYALVCSVGTAAQAWL